MDSRGVTLIELLVTVAIITIVMVVVGFGFVGWQARYKVDSETKELQSAFMDARMRARQKSTVFFIQMDKSSDDKRRECIVYEDDGNGMPDAGDKEVRDLSKKGLSYRVDWDEGVGTPLTGQVVTLAVDAKGFISRRDPGDLSKDVGLPSSGGAEEPDRMHIWLVDPDGRRYIKADYGTESVPDIANDCVMISATRINIGKLNEGGGCDEK